MNFTARSVYCVGKLLLIFVAEPDLHGFVALDERQRRIRAGFCLRVMRPHVVRVRQAEVFIEAMVRREKLRMAPEMPFARHARWRSPFA